MNIAVTAFCLERSVSVPPGHKSQCIFGMEVTAYIVYECANIYSVYKRKRKFCTDTFCVRMAAILLEGKEDFFWGILFCFFS